MEKILEIANRYAQGKKEVEERRAVWLEHYKDVREHLAAIATFLNEKAGYKPGFFVDVNHAYNEEINGTCAKMPSLSFRSGDMPLNISFKNANGERKEYTEEGFHIVFTPTITGQILVMMQPHYSSATEQRPEYEQIAVVDDPAQLTNDIVDQLIARGMEGAFYSSFTGMVALQQKELEESQKQQYRPTPIGFKRYESTEKVQ